MWSAESVSGNQAIGFRARYVAWFPFGNRAVLRDTFRTSLGLLILAAIDEREGETDTRDIIEKRELFNDSTII